jgi:HK97 gp10 family phage protein
MADTNIIGGAELARMLATLPAKIEQNIMRSALRAGAAVIRAEAKTTAPVLSGALKKSIRISGKAKKGQITVSVKMGGKTAPHAHLVEFGTRAHKIAPNAAQALAIGGALVGGADHPGAKPSPFFRAAFDAKSAEAIAAVADQIRKRLTKEGINIPAPEEV